MDKMTLEISIMAGAMFTKNFTSELATKPETITLENIVEFTQYPNGVTACIDSSFNTYVVSTHYITKFRALNLVKNEG